MELSRDKRTKLLEKVCHLVEKKYYDPTFNGQDLLALIASRRQQILAAETLDEFEKEMNGFLSQLGASHVGFFHRSVRRVPARRSIYATFHKGLVDGAHRWIFQDVHEGGPAFHAGLRPGDLLLKIDGRDCCPPEDPTFPMGTTTPVVVKKPDGSELSVSLAVPASKSKKFPYCELRLVSRLKLAGDVGYLKVSVFPGQVGIDVSREINNAVRQLEDCHRLVVDLRGNSGGGLGMLRLMSYLTPGKLPIGYSLTRRRAEKGYNKQHLTRFEKIPSTKAALPWLILRYGFIDKSIVLVTEGLGPKKFHNRIVLLMNEHSASASEVIGAFAVENQLATIVGTPTVGRLLSGNSFRVGKGFVLVLPTGAYLTWRGQLIEGKGVTPDHAVEWLPEAAASACDNQLERAVEIAKAL